MKEFLFGVGSSIVAAILIYLFRYQLSGLVHFLFSKVYPNVTGQWTVKQYFEHDDVDDVNGESQTYLVPADDEESIFIKLKIKQFANRITGTLEQIENGNTSYIQEVKGKVTASRILLLTLEAKSDGHHNYGSMLLKMSSSSKELKGYETFLCSECQDTGYYYLELTKDK